jgi:hypothetical protein
MATITISGIDGNGNLIMTNNGNASTDKNSNVVWVVTSNDVTSISISIATNPGIWSSIPAPVGNSKNWQGTVGDFPRQGEDYNIGFTTSVGKSGSHDPRIQINP